MSNKKSRAASRTDFFIITSLFQFCLRQNFHLAFQRGGRYVLTAYYVIRPSPIEVGDIFFRVIFSCYVCLLHVKHFWFFLYGAKG